MAKPMLLAAVSPAVLIPITRPAASASGPPELPGLMGASVWITSGRFSPVWLRPAPTLVRVRCTAEITPTVTEPNPVAPSGLPMAATGCPGRTLVESPNSASGRLPSGTLSTAMSSSGSVPWTWAV